MSFEPIKVHYDPYGDISKGRAEQTLKNKGKYKHRIYFAALSGIYYNEPTPQSIYPKQVTALTRYGIASKLLSKTKRGADKGSIPKLSWIERMFYIPLYVQHENNPPVWVLVNKRSLGRFNGLKGIFKNKFKQLKDLTSRQAIIQSEITNKINEIANKS